MDAANVPLKAARSGFSGAAPCGGVNRSATLVTMSLTVRDFRPSLGGLLAWVPAVSFCGWGMRGSKQTIPCAPDNAGDRDQ